MNSDEHKRKQALDYHSGSAPGKLAIAPTKPLRNLGDLSLAYSPGVSEPCIEIVKNPASVSDYTGRQNLVGVVTNGTAVLGLGDIGPLASKPVMEGKAVLFKHFAGINCFDIELNEPNPKKLADIICALEPTFGAINLEDIKAPDCFIVEDICRAKMNIPVFHDDQHGTAIVVAAATLNATRISGRDLSDLRIIALGAGAAGIASLNMLTQLGVQHKNISVFDRKGILHAGRSDLFEQQSAFAKTHGGLTLEMAFKGADMVLGLAGPNLITSSMIKLMQSQPIVFALANPTPEIWPEEVQAIAPDALIATGRSDYPNQVNNALCFPFIFKGALDAGVKDISSRMKLACVYALADLAKPHCKRGNAEAALLPDLFDKRLESLSGAVYEAALN